VTLALLLALQTAVPSSLASIDRVVVAEGESLAVAAVGRGTPVVLVPGLVGSAFAFRKVIPLLPPDQYRVIVVEPLGVGRSSRPRNANYSLTAQADRLAAALDTIGVTEAIVVAHSVGASIALRLAYRHPERVGALLSLDGGPAEAAATPGFKRALRFVPLVKWTGGINRVRKEMRKGLKASSGDASWVTEEALDGYTAGIATDLDASLLVFLRMGSAREPERLDRHLEEIQAPVWLLRGTAPHSDGVSDADVDRLASLLPSFHVDSVPAAGHHLHEERPDAVAQAVVRLHDTIQGTRIASATPPRRP